MILSEEQVLIRDTARAFAQEQVLPHVRAWEAAGEIPRALLSEMGRLGFMGIPAVIEQTLETVGASGVHSFDSLYDADARARDVAGEYVAVHA